MKGIQDKNGPDNLEIILVNNGGHTKRTIEGAEMRVERYGMERFPRVRFDRDEFNTEVAAAFGQYGYGKFVIDKEGVLVGIDLRRDAFTSTVERASGTTTPKVPLDGFALKVQAVKLKGGASGVFNRSGKLKTDLTGSVQLQFSMPNGWHVSGGAGDAPEVSVAYSGAVEIGELEPWNPSEEDPVPPLLLPLKAPKGTPIGRYLIHGTVRVVLCNDDGCLPPIELPWDVELEAL